MMWQMFGGRGPVAVEEANSAARALPATWYTSQEMYDLERRAIFSRKWQLITHSARLAAQGDWLKFDIASFQIVVCKDRLGEIHGFHNVCRHRAFPVVLGEAGTSKIFSCKYHGWSYGLNGKLSKAPGYQELDGFEKDKNGLFPVHLHIDKNGFIWVNLDAKQKPDIAWEDDFADIDAQERYQQFNFADYQFDHVWQMDADVNWKISADNYNECYHCPTTHPDIGALADLSSYSVTGKDMNIIHDPGTTDAQREAGLVVASTYHFPNASTNVTPHFFMIQRFVPHGPKSSTMHYQVFRNKHSSDESFQCVNQIYKRIMSEDKELCNLAQKNLNAGTFINGELHPKMEKGPLYFQKLVRQTVTQHHQREQAAGSEVWPARQKIPVAAANSTQSLADSKFCASLAPCQASNTELVW